MNRQLFGLWGIDLNDDDFACAVAAAGAFDAEIILAPPTAQLLTAAHNKSEIIRFQVGSILQSIFDQASRKDVPIPAMPANFYKDAWQQAFPHDSFRIRIEIEKNGLPMGFDVRGLIDLLSRKSVRASSVYIRQDDPLLPVAWDWPLRVGFLKEPRSIELADGISSSRFHKLFKVMFLPKNGSECDVLLMPRSLRSALQQLLSIQFRLRADCVLITGGVKTDFKRAHNLFDVLRTEAETSGVASLFVPEKRRVEWFNSFLINLSHNQPIDVALLSTARNLSIASPLLICSRRLVEIANLGAHTKRLSKRLQTSARSNEKIKVPDEVAERMRLPKGDIPIGDLGKKLENESVYYDWDKESGDATSLTELKRNLEVELGEPVALATANGGDEVIAQDNRSLQAQFFEGEGPNKIKAGNALRVDTSYAVEIRIGLPDAEWITAPVPLPGLPPSPTGHNLQIAFVELPSGKHRNIAAPHIGHIHLPPNPNESSDVFRFFIRTDSQPYSMRARVIVLHELRVLQTMILTAEVTSNPNNLQENKITMKEETLVHEGFANFANRTPYDASLIVNDNDGNLGLTTVTKGEVRFDEPTGLVETLKQISSIVSDIGSKIKKPGTIKSKVMVKVLKDLAHHGNALINGLPPLILDRLLKAHRVQVVETRVGSLLPVEFFYNRRAPLEDAILCGHAQSALTEAQIGVCPNEEKNNVICPCGFWGFDRVIERCPPLDPGDKDYVLSEPSRERNRLHIADKILFAASDLVTEDTKVEIRKILKQFLGKEPLEAKNWAEWETKVQEESPSLLILLPHSDETANKIATLEIGGDALMNTLLEPEKVLKKESTPPMVLLLGCSTKLPNVLFQTFVNRFKRKGAAVVIGTISTIRGRHSVAFIRQFFQALKNSSQRPDPVLGDVLLEVKQKLLGAGDPFVLSLVAYGDAEWRL